MNDKNKYSVEISTCFRCITKLSKTCVLNPNWDVWQTKLKVSKPFSEKHKIRVQQGDKLDQVYCSVYGLYTYIGYKSDSE